MEYRNQTIWLQLLRLILGIISVCASVDLLTSSRSDPTLLKVVDLGIPEQFLSVWVVANREYQKKPKHRGRREEDRESLFVSLSPEVRVKFMALAPRMCAIAAASR